MFQISLTNNKGFQWSENDHVCFKGYFFDSNNNFIEGEKALLFFEEVNSQERFKAALKEMNGIFTVIIVQDNECFIASDSTRFFPVFYSQLNDQLCISDDFNFLKAKVSVSYNSESIYEFEGLGHTIGRETLIKDIYQIQSAEYLFIEGSKITAKGFHYSHSVPNYISNSYNQLKLDISQAFQNSFDRLIRSLNGKTAVIPLSGGYDSRLIALFLKQHQYTNVVCYTYGKTNTADMLLSKRVAEALDFPWHFIEYTDELIEGYTKTDDFITYCTSSFHHSSMLFLQEYFATKYLKENKLIPNDSVFIPGHDGGALGGGYLIKVIPKSLKKEKLDLQVSQYYPYASKDLKKHVTFQNKIKKTLLDFNAHIDNAKAHNAYEDFIFKEVTAKVIFNSSKVYEYFGYEVRFPFWDKELLTLFKQIPLEYKINKKVYVDVLKDFFTSFNLNFDSELHPSYTKLKIQKLKNIVKGLLPDSFVKDRLYHNDWLNASKITIELEEMLERNQIEFNKNYTDFNQINILWYLYFCQNKIQ